MHQGLEGFPAVGTCVIAGSSNQELHTESSMMIITMRYDISDHKYLLVLLSDVNRINSIRIEEKGLQIVNIGSDL